MEKQINFLLCSNPKCAALYEATRHNEGKAVKVGKMHYCKRGCATEHSEAIKHGERTED